MGDVPPDEAAGSPDYEDSTPYEKAGLSPGGQIYTNTELGKYVYGGKPREERERERERQTDRERETETETERDD